MNDISYFENSVSKKIKLRMLAVIGPDVLLRQQDMHLALAYHGSSDRIADSKRACAERWERRERQELAARLTARS